MEHSVEEATWQTALIKTRIVKLKLHNYTNVILDKSENLCNIKSVYLIFITQFYCFAWVLVFFPAF